MNAGNIPTPDVVVSIQNRTLDPQRLTPACTTGTSENCIRSTTVPPGTSANSNGGRVGIWGGGGVVLGEGPRGGEVGGCKLIED